MADIRLNDILAQHAEQLGEVDAEDPAPAPRPAYMFMLERASSPSPPLDSTPRRLKRPRRSSPESLAAAADVANADSGVDSGLNALGVPHQVRGKKRPEKPKANRNAKPSTGRMGRRNSAIENVAARAAESAAQVGDCGFQEFEIPPRRVLGREEALAEPDRQTFHQRVYYSTLVELMSQLGYMELQGFPCTFPGLHLYIFQLNAASSTRKFRDGSRFGIDVINAIISALGHTFGLVSSAFLYLSNVRWRHENSRRLILAHIPTTNSEYFGNPGHYGRISVQIKYINLPEAKAAT
ncbi:hypothetical protein DFH09DRAFT_1085477 [Mycena vulgaris]|nr:hypothetical protein DFH09DRAFT_1085477 [Mycena vulgaris]